MALGNKKLLYIYIYIYKRLPYQFSLTKLYRICSSAHASRFAHQNVLKPYWLVKIGLSVLSISFTSRVQKGQTKEAALQCVRCPLVVVVN